MYNCACLHSACLQSSSLQFCWSDRVSLSASEVTQETTGNQGSRYNPSVQKMLACCQLDSNPCQCGSSCTGWFHYPRVDLLCWECITLRLILVVPSSPDVIKHHVQECYGQMLNVVPFVHPCTVPFFFSFLTMDGIETRGLDCGTCDGLLVPACGTVRNVVANVVPFVFVCAVFSPS